MHDALHPLNFFAMAKKQAAKQLKNFRIDGDLLKRAKENGQHLDVRPSLTAIVETALREWCEKIEARRKKAAK